MKRLIYILLNLSIVYAFTQVDNNAYGYYDYAYRYSTQNNYGSPRINALGGAATTLGGDYSQHHINPAGLGFYQKNDLGFSFSNDINTLNHKETNSSSNKNQFNGLIST